MIEFVNSWKSIERKPMLVNWSFLSQHLNSKDQFDEIPSNIFLSPAAIAEQWSHLICTNTEVSIQVSSFIDAGWVIEIPWVVEEWKIATHKREPEPSSSDGIESRSEFWLKFKFKTGSWVGHSKWFHCRNYFKFHAVLEHMRNFSLTHRVLRRQHQKNVVCVLWCEQL